jgi:hypothetical protein
VSARRRWRGLGALVRDAVEHGSRAVETIQKQTAARPFAILALIPSVAPVAKVVQTVHDLSVSGVHGAIRLVNRAVGAVVEAALPDDEAD